MDDILITLTPSLQHPDQQRLVHASLEFQDELRLIPGLTVHERTIAEPGKKGSSLELIVVLGGYAAINGLVRVIELWLARPGNRSIRISRTVEGSSDLEIHLSGENISEETVKAAVGSLLDAQEKHAEQ